MKDRRFKVHYLTGLNKAHRTLCGVDGTTTVMANAMTCRICMFKYLAMQAPWAQGFLDELRGRVGRGQPAPIFVPATAPEPMDGVIERAGNSLGRPFRYDGGSQKAISELLPELAPGAGTIQPVMQHGGAPAESVGVQPREVAQGPGDAG